MNDLFSTEISIEERTGKKKKNIMTTNGMFQFEKKIYSLKKLKTCKIKK